MQAGDLVKFKVHHYHKSYGIGVIIGVFSADPRDAHRRWALFSSRTRERLVVRLDEMEVISENR